jgi:hypothetical protein
LNPKKLCDGNQTAIGERAFDNAPEDIKQLFNSYRKANNLDYNEVIESLADSKNVSASSLKEAAYDSSSTLIQRASNQVIRPYSK